MKKKILIYIVIFIIILGISFLQNYINKLFFQQTDSVIALQVGQGDAVLLESDLGARVLVDGGPDNSVVYRLGDYLPLFDMSLDGVFMTHADLDHVLGTIEVMRRYQVKYLFITDFIKDKYLGQLALQEAEKNNVNVVIVNIGDVIDLSGMKISVLWPDESMNYSNANDTSIVIRVDFQYGSVMLTGDASIDIEEKLINIFSNNPEILDVDVLKAGHHGSRTATGPAFVEATSPQFAIISAGLNNKFGHPHMEVIDILNKYNVKIVDNVYQDLQIEFSENGLVVY